MVDVASGLNLVGHASEAWAIQPGPRIGTSQVIDPTSGLFLVEEQFVRWIPANVFHRID